MSTIYTLNGKVLKNSATDKWLAKKEEPAGFVMNASNAIIDTSGVGNASFLAWKGPAYPSGYDGQGKQFIVVNNNSNETIKASIGMMYSTGITENGPKAINNVMTSNTGTLNANQAPVSQGYGAYLIIPVINTRAAADIPTEAEMQEYAANITITILD